MVLVLYPDGCKHIETDKPYFPMRQWGDKAWETSNPSNVKFNECLLSIIKPTLDI